MIFFCPLDLFYKCVCFLPVKLIFVAMKEVVRVRKIAVGIHHAHHHYHHGWFVMIATGWVKGTQKPGSEACGAQGSLGRCSPRSAREKLLWFCCKLRSRLCKASTLTLV